MKSISNLFKYKFKLEFIFVFYAFYFMCVTREFPCLFQGREEISALFEKASSPFTQPFVGGRPENDHRLVGQITGIRPPVFRVSRVAWEKKICRLVVERERESGFEMDGERML